MAGPDAPAGGGFGRWGGDDDSPQGARGRVGVSKSGGGLFLKGVYVCVCLPFRVVSDEPIRYYVRFLGWCEMALRAGTWRYTIFSIKPVVWVYSACFPTFSLVLGMSRVNRAW